MKRAGKLLLCLFGMIALTQVVRAVVDDAATNASNGQADGSSDMPYSAIWTRNVFDLKPPPPPVEPPKTNLPPPNVKLAGILTIFQKKQALLSMQEQIPGRPPSKEESYIMTEGERRGGLEVLEIDTKAETVKIKNDEIVSTLHFETNHIGGGGAPGPGSPPPPHPFTPPPNFAPPGMPNPGNGMPLPNRMMRSSMPNAQASPQGYAQPVSSPAGFATGYNNLGNNFATGSAGGTSLPNSLLNQAATQQSPVGQTPTWTAEEQVAMMLAQRQQPNANLPPQPPVPGLNLNENESGSSVPPVPNAPVPQLPPWVKSRQTGSFQLPPTP